MKSNDSSSSGKNIGPEISKGETNKRGTNSNEESFQNTNILSQIDSELMGVLMDGKESNCVDIKNESRRDNENISANENLMNNGQNDPKIKDYVEYKTLLSN